MIKFFCSVMFLSVLTGCATADFGSPDTYQRYDVQRIGQFEQATILRVRPITIESSSGSSGIASIVSAAAGAFLGSQVIGNGSGRYIAGALSGSVSGLVAQRISAAMSRHSGVEVFLRRANGQTVVVTQVDDQQFAVGQQVFLVSNGSGYRITH
ncbi:MULTISPECIES: glycine zipper 2TM domain-containing protein [unclassified Caballeronia]|uniref:glycine zipper 2TM domain-containing protein n=1 Tax=unclassified Caballeronia TaxID=2646786 RepID=UPI0020278291|nr:MULTISPECIES: glycine zipper 2TM domain-containing protein [unclassified Caballeronia]